MTTAIPRRARRVVAARFIGEIGRALGVRECANTGAGCGPELAESSGLGAGTQSAAALPRKSKRARNQPERGPYDAPPPVSTRIHASYVGGAPSVRSSFMFRQRRLRRSPPYPPYRPAGGTPFPAPRCITGSNMIRASSSRKPGTPLHVLRRQPHPPRGIRINEFRHGMRDLTRKLYNAPFTRNRRRAFHRYCHARSSTAAARD